MTKGRLFLGILGRFIAWGAGVSVAIGAILPAVLLILGTIVWGFLLSGLTLSEALANTEIQSLFLITLYSIPIGAIIGLAVGLPAGVINGVMMGLVSIWLFHPPTNETDYRLISAALVSIVSVFITIIGFWILVVDTYSGFQLWMFPTVIVVGVVTALVSQRIAGWYLSVVGTVHRDG